jgi:small subunit ribosomal protein S21
MLEVRLGKGESIDKALRRFKKQCNKEGLTKEIRKRKHYVKPSEKRRRRKTQKAAGVNNG